MPDQPSRRIPWPRIFAEGVVIVASILLALAADTWWADRQLLQDLRSDLQSVQDQLQDVRTQVDNANQRLSRILVTGNELLALLNDQADLESTVVPDTVVFWGVDAQPTAELSIGSVEALIASGRFGAISDPKLRINLANLAGRIEDVREDQLSGREYTLNVLGPRLDPYLDRSQVAPLRTAPGFPFVRRPAVSLGTVRFPNSLEIRNGITVRLGYYQRSIQAMESLGPELDSVLIQIGQEVGMAADA